MDAPKPPALSGRIPWWTLLMMGASVGVALAPSWKARLIYDRSDILAGQFWRMWTGQLVHFSTSHLVCDLVPLGMAGCILETRGWPRFGWFCLLTPWIIGAAMLMLAPHLAWCAGSSGVASAMVTLMALDGLSDNSPWRYVCGATLLGLLGEMAFQGFTGHCFLVTANGSPVVVSVASHVAGAAGALCFWLLQKRVPLVRIGLSA